MVMKHKVLITDKSPTSDFSVIEHELSQHSSNLQNPVSSPDHLFLSRSLHNRVGHQASFVLNIPLIYTRGSSLYYSFPHEISAQCCNESKQNVFMDISPTWNSPISKQALSEHSNNLHSWIITPSSLSSQDLCAIWS